MNPDSQFLSFARDRVTALLQKLAVLAAGDTETGLSLSPLHDELDAIAYGINVLADELRWAHARITASERVKADELREALAHLGRVAMLDVLAGSLAHEISQPLTAATTNAAAAVRLLALPKPPIDRLRATVNDILRESQRAADVVHEMRTLLKKDATAHEPVDVNGSVTTIVKLVERNATGRRIVLDLHLNPGLEPVIGNRIQIEQVVLNLLMNAFDAVQEREPALRRVRLRTLPDDLEAAIEVTDEGTGLSDDALAALFQPFHTTKRDGLGLGLWICRGIVAAHGGTLAAHRNTTGTGMTFSARFPLWRSMGPEEGRLLEAERLQERG